MQHFWEAWSRRRFTLTLPRLVLDEKRSRQPGRICFGAYNVPETGKKHAVLQLALSQINSSTQKKKKKKDNKRTHFPCLLVGGEEAFRTEKTQQCAQAKQET